METHPFLCSGEKKVTIGDGRQNSDPYTYAE